MLGCDGTPATARVRPPRAGPIMRQARSAYAPGGWCWASATWLAPRARAPQAAAVRMLYLFTEDPLSTDYCVASIANCRAPTHRSFQDRDRAAIFPLPRAPTP